MGNVEIDVPELHELIKSHGVLLEHRTRKSLLKYFGASAGRDFCSERVNFHLTISAGEIVRESGCIEIDVFMEAHRRYSNFTYERPGSGSGTRAEVCAYDGPLHELIVVECKGGAPGNILLCHAHKGLESPNCTEEIIQKGFYPKQRLLGSDMNESTREEGAIVRRTNQLVENGVFYTFVEENKNKKERICYKENKLFDHALLQTQLNASYADSILRRGVPLNEAYRVIPLIITNVPICVMSIDGDHVKFEVVPWAHLLHHGKPQAGYNLEYVHLVTYDYLHQFLDAVLEPSASLTEYPQGTTRELESLMIGGTWDSNLCPHNPLAPPP